MDDHDDDLVALRLVVDLDSLEIATLGSIHTGFVLFGILTKELKVSYS